MNKSALTNVALVIASLVFLGGIFEIALRIAGYNPFGEFFDKEGASEFIQVSKNPTRIFEARPGAQGAAWGTQIRINKAGFRGRDYAPAKPANTYRIVVIGDSIAFGNNIPEGKNYPALLETLFANSSRPVEVLNLALGGYDTLQEVATLEDIGLAFSPDLVILGYCINDIGIASGNLNYIKRLKNYGSPIYHSRLTQFIRVQLDRAELIQYSKNANRDDSFDNTYKLMQADISGDVVLQQKMQQLTNLLAASADNSDEKTIFSHDYTRANRVQRLRFGLERLKALQQQNHFAVLTVVTPYLLETPNSQPIYQSVYAIVEHEMARLDFPTLNFYPMFASVGLNTLVLKKKDGIHPNEQGHDMIAKELYRSIDISNNK